MLLRCINILASVDDNSAGPSYSVSRLSEELARLSVQVLLYTVEGWRQGGGEAGERAAIGECVAFPQAYANVFPLNRLCLSPRLREALAHRDAVGTVFHTHGLWLMPNVYPAWAARNGARTVVSPRGMLGPQALRFSRLRKLAFWHLLQKRALDKADCLHATSEQEYREIRRMGLRNPVAIIPNGIDIPAPDPGSAGSERTVLSLGRIHPKKGLDTLVKAWAGLERKFPDWRLRFVGPDELGYTARLKALAAEHHLSRVSFEPPLYGEAKFAALAGADLFVLPTLNENFGLVVAESLAAGTPVITTKGAPWSGLSQRQCGWWIDAGVETLAAALADAMVVPRDALKSMGAKGRAWMEHDFSWQKIAGEMLAVYRWLADQGEMPPTIRLQ